MTTNADTIVTTKNMMKYACGSSKNVPEEFALMKVGIFGVPKFG